MTTLIDTVQPDDAHLGNIFATLLTDVSTPDEYVSRCLTSTLSVLKSNPATYRSYGPWWPAVKELLVNSGAGGEVGTQIEAGTAAIYSRKNPEFTLLAAQLYSNERTDRGCIYSAVHELPVNDDADDTDMYLYFSTDEEMERQIAVRG